MYFRSGNRQLERVSGFLPGSLVVSKEENLVLLDRTANRASEYIGYCAGNIRAHRVVAGILREWVARLLGIAVPVIVNRTVKGVRARLGLHDSHARHCRPELG